jgi:hypothetical protein
MNVLGLRFTQLNFWLTFEVFQSLFLTQFLNLKIAIKKYWYWLKNQIGSLLWHLTDVELMNSINSFPRTGMKKAFLTKKKKTFCSREALLRYWCSFVVPHYNGEPCHQLFSKEGDGQSYLSEQKLNFNTRDVPIRHGK